MATVDLESQSFNHWQASLPRSRSFSGGSRTRFSSSRKRLAIEMVPKSFRKVTGVRQEFLKKDGIPVRLVELNLDGKPLGFQIERRLNEDLPGGRRWQVLISGLEKDSTAHSQGLLCEGDEVISINGTFVSDVGSQQEISLLLQVSDCLSLAIAGEMVGEMGKQGCNAVDAAEVTTEPPAQKQDCCCDSLQGIEVSQSPGDTPTKSPSSPQFRAVRSRNCVIIDDDSRETSTAKLNANRDCPRTAEDLTWIKNLQQLSSRWTNGLPQRSGTRMLQLAQIFVPEPDDECISLSERRALLAKCLAEEFDLPFLADPSVSESFA